MNHNADIAAVHLVDGNATPRYSHVDSGAAVKEPERVSPRILHFLMTPFRGGAEEHALSLLRALRKYGFEPFVAAPAQLLEIMPELVEFPLSKLSVGQSPIGWIRVVAQLSKVIRSEHIDLIHCHSVIGTICAVAAARIIGGPPIIETCHGRESWREGKRLKGSFWVDRQVGRFVQRYIAVSQATARHLSEAKRIPLNKIVIIPNGRDLAALVPPNKRFSSRARADLVLGDKPTILLLGRISKEKGHAVLLEALRILRARRLYPIAIFAGDGPLEGELKATCDATGLSAQVRFLGYRTDVPTLFAAANLVVLPSFSEGLPLVAIEALAAARALVATNVDGIPEIVRDNETGLLVPPNDPAALAEAIARVLQDAALANRLGTRGRVFAEANFDVRVQIERTMEQYRELTCRTPAAGKWWAFHPPSNRSTPFPVTADSANNRKFQMAENKA
jgi:glycosyltransferase involved in cell wall biosynthesis